MNRPCLRNQNSRTGCGSTTKTPNVLIGMIQIRIRLDSRLMHAGMTDFGLAVCFKIPSVLTLKFQRP
jgi:hypothetical protein